MADRTSIEWTDATLNFWWGCTKVGPGCDHCYAETLAKRFGVDWGLHEPRRQIKGARQTLRKLKPGTRVFVQSMSDLFDTEVDRWWLIDAWAALQDRPDLLLQIVTKRISVVERRLANICAPWLPNAGLLISVVNQAEADRDIPRLIALKEKLGIPWIGLSMEPLLGWVQLRPEWLAHLDWVIVGGESGPHARPMHAEWVRRLRDQCAAARVPFFFKQWGEWVDWQQIASGFTNRIRYHRARNQRDRLADLRPPFKGDFVPPAGPVPWRGNMLRVGKKHAGNLFDGRQHQEWPHHG